MKSHYDCDNTVPTSARSENYFNFVKNTMLESHQPTRVDKFLIKHIRSISARIKEARSSIGQFKMEQKELKSENCKKEAKNTINSVFNLQENWRNQVKPPTMITLSSGRERYFM